MGLSQLNIDNVEVRLAKSEAEIRAAQRLRYKVFYEEYAATPNEVMAAEKRDFDGFDDYADHLIVLDNGIMEPQDRIVGTYRLLRKEAADRCGQFYTSDEYDIDPLLNSGATLLELGRSCVLADYRTRPVMQLLWLGITEYMLEHEIGLMFGCASLHGTDVSALSKSLSYLHHYHRAPENLCPKAINSRYVDMNIIPKDDINTREVFSELPPLIKGYIRLGATIGDGAVIDHQFNTTDVCIVLQIKELSARYREHYTRKAERSRQSENKVAVGG